MGSTAHVGRCSTCRHRRGPLPCEVGHGPRRRLAQDERDRHGDPGRSLGVPEASVQDDRRHPHSVGDHRLRDIEGDLQTGRFHRTELRSGWPVPNAGVHPRLSGFGLHRLHRHDAGHPWQRPHRRCSAHQQHAQGTRRGVPHRRRGRHVHRRPRPARRIADHHGVPEHLLGHPHRLRLWWIAACAVPACRRRHLHQGGRRGRRPGGQGRSWHPRRRPPQPGDHRRQRGRQRRRLRRYGGRPVRELRGHPRRVDHPRCRCVQVDLPGRSIQVGPRPHVPAGRSCHRCDRLDHRHLLREGQAGRDQRPEADQQGFPRRRFAHPHRHPGGCVDIRR